MTSELDPDDDWTVITSFANLRHAASMAARAKRGNANVARFLERREAHLFALQAELRADTWRPGSPTVFEIRDPKPRAITAAPFRDRVVHHALIGPLEERFDAAMSPNTYACRRGMGTHRALDHAQAALRGATHFLKLDIARCFPSIEHEVVRASFALAAQVRRLYWGTRVERVPQSIQRPPQRADASCISAAGAGSRPRGTWTRRPFASITAQRFAWSCT